MVEELKVTVVSITDGAEVTVVLVLEPREMAEGNRGFEDEVGGGLSEPSGPSPSA